MFGWPLDAPQGYKNSPSICVYVVTLHAYVSPLNGAIPIRPNINWQHMHGSSYVAINIDLDLWYKHSK